MLILLTGLIGQCLTGDIHQIVFEVIVAAILLSHAVHQACCLAGIGRIIIILHLRPRRSLEIVQRRATTEDALVRALLVVACGTVIDAMSKNHPSLFKCGILNTVTSLHIILQPCLLGEFLRSPRQLAHQFEHHGVVL